MKPHYLNPDSPSERRAEKKVFAIELGKHLRRIRESRNLSQEKLSEKAGYYHTYVNKIEMGTYSPSLHTIWRLADALGLSLSEFLKDF